jgi:glycosyltransferase involved in cell wall biosynthesis
MAHLNFMILLLRPLFRRSLRGGATRVIVRQNGTVSAILAAGDLPSYTRLLFRHLYRRADRVICQSQAMADDLAPELGKHAGRIAVLPNPVDFDAIGATTEDAQSRWIRSGPHLLAVGRLSPEKGYDLLLEALAEVRKEFRSCDLTILGAGNLEAELMALCRKLGVAQAVRFAGMVENPAAYFPGASLFVLPSRHEGMPNAMLEAAAGGLPIAATPASGGIADLLRGQPGCFVTAEISAEALAATLLTALAELQPGERFSHAFAAPFRLDNAIRSYETLIDAVLGDGHQAGRP